MSPRCKSFPVLYLMAAHVYDNSSEALATDVNIIQRSLDSTLFPGISSDVAVHSGFADEQEK
jgi:hypothetical protein